MSGEGSQRAARRVSETGIYISIAIIPLKQNRYVVTAKLTEPSICVPKKPKNKSVSKLKNISRTIIALLNLMLSKLKKWKIAK